MLHDGLMAQCRLAMREELARFMRIKVKLAGWFVYNFLYSCGGSYVDVGK